jgi:hypothetical protein
VQTAAAATPPALQKAPERRAPDQLELNLDQPGLKPAAGSPGEPPSVAAALVEELHAVHPKPGLPDKAIPEVERILAAAEDVEATIEQIRVNYASWKAHWEMLRPGQFIPQLWRWFRDGEWKRTVGKPVRRENYYERCERERQEYGGYQWTEEEKRQFEALAERENRELEWREKQRGQKIAG